MDETQKPKILLVDDKPENLLAMEALLESPGLNIVTALSGNEALGLMLEHDFAMVLLDVQMPEMDGFETVELIRNSDRTRHVPIIFVTAISKETDHITKGYEKGAVDYLFKPVNPHMLKSKVKIFLELYSQKISLQETANTLEKTITDLEKSKQVIEDQNKALNELSIIDELTGLFNRRHMIEILNSEFNRAMRYGSDLTCLILDLDFFKEVNDTLGHQFGDFVLKEFSERIKTHSRSADYSFRYGGEEFMLLLPHTDIEGASIWAEKIREHCEAKPYNNGTDKTTVTASIGLASFKEHLPERPEDFLGFADKALYQAKAEGRNRVVLYRRESLSLGPESIVRNSKDLNYLKDHLASILEKTKQSAISSLELLVRDSGGPELNNCSRRVMKYLDLIGERLNLPPAIIETFKRASLLHDCFKILLGQLLMGAKDTLTEEEDELIRHHPYMMNELAEMFDFFSDEKSVLLYHHENYDGSGYPEGLEGDQIPLGARIFNIADSLVSMTSERSYKETLSLEEAVKELEENAGGQFDPALTSLFLEIIEQEESQSASNDSTIKKNTMEAANPPGQSNIQPERPPQGGEKPKPQAG